MFVHLGQDLNGETAAAVNKHLLMHLPLRRHDKVNDSFVRTCSILHILYNVMQRLCTAEFPQRALQGQQMLQTPWMELHHTRTVHQASSCL